MGHNIESSAGRARWSTARPSKTAKIKTEGSREAPRSGSGSVPGAEFPTFVYVSVLVAFAWVMLASWLAFARTGDAALAIGVAIVLGIVFFALPVIVHRVAVANSWPERESAHEFLSTPVETETGRLSGASAWLQVLIIPLALALAATLIGAISVVEHF